MRHSLILALAMAMGPTAFANNELDSETQQHVEAHLRACQSCADRLKTMQEHDAMLRSVLVRSQSRQVRSQRCCSAEELSAYARAEHGVERLEAWDIAYYSEKLRARRYDVSFMRGGKDLVERIAFVLDGQREYELLCRFVRHDAGAGKRCLAFLASFRPA